LPYLVNEVTHLYNCTCENGFQGDKCEKTTTLSMVATSLISVTTEREEGYDINLQFRTTLPNGVLAFGTTGEKNEPVSYILELINGRLNLHSSLLNKWEGVFIGSKLNDSNWHKVFVAINTSHLVLSATDGVGLRSAAELHLHQQLAAMQLGSHIRVANICESTIRGLNMILIMNKFY